MDGAQQRGATAADAVATGWPALLGALVAGTDLDAAQARWAMDEVVSGRSGPATTAALLVGLAAKGVSVAELGALAEGMLAVAVPLPVPEDVRARSVDIVGTGGDGAGTVNLSTTAALVVAGTGAVVVKHGNRAASSLCGAADVLAELGVRLDLPPARVAELAAEVGVTFAYAPAFHPAMAHAGPVRAALGIPTAFNLLGPLLNPGRPPAMAVGVAAREALPLIAGVLARRGTRALVVRGDDGLDELTTTAPAAVWDVRDGRAVPGRVDAADLAMAPASVEDLRGGDAPANAAVTRAVLAGRGGPVRDAVLLAAACALVALDDAPTGARTVTERLAAALPTVERSVDSGAAADVLERWVSASRS